MAVSLSLIFVLLKHLAPQRRVISTYEMLKKKDVVRKWKERD